MTDIDTAAIEAAEDARFAAVLARDLPALADLLHEDLIYRHSGGVTDTKSSYLDGLRDGVWVYHGVRRSEQSITVTGDTALVFNRLALEMEANGTPQSTDALALAVWVRDAKWQLIGVQSGAVPHDHA